MPGISGEPGTETSLTFQQVPRFFCWQSAQQHDFVTDGAGDSLPLSLGPSNTERRQPLSQYTVTEAVDHIGKRHEFSFSNPAPAA